MINHPFKSSKPTTLHGTEVTINGYVIPLFRLYAILHEFRKNVKIIRDLFLLLLPVFVLILKSDVKSRLLTLFSGISK
jgi:hypothetical protein